VTAAESYKVIRSKLGSPKVQKKLDTRWKQIDKFEMNVKPYGNAKTAWRRKYVAMEVSWRRLR
jgi:hypothetical protein